MANNQLQSPSAEDDVLSSAGRNQIAADEDEREQHQDEIERVHRQRTIILRPLWLREYPRYSVKRSYFHKTDERTNHKIRS